MNEIQVYQQHETLQKQPVIKANNQSTPIVIGIGLGTVVIVYLLTKNHYSVTLQLNGKNFSANASFLTSSAGVAA